MTTTALHETDQAKARFRTHKDTLAARTVTHWLSWRNVRCKVEETSDYMGPGWTLLQLHVIAPRDTPFPLTHTGYLAHGIDAEDLSAAGGTIAFLTDWMNREAATPRYAKIDARSRQGDLLDWSTTQDLNEDERR